MYQRAPVAAKGAAKGGAKGGARQVVSGSRVNGNIVEWKGNHGWVQPFYPINHPDASKKPYIFMSVSDIEQELDDMNPTVSFVVYSDGSGLGAQEVRQAGAGGFAAYGSRSVQIASARASPWMAAGAGKGAGKAGGKAAAGGAPQLRMTHEQISGKVQAALTANLWEPIQEIATLEETWSPEETLKRVVRYLYKSGMAEDPTKKSWQDSIRKFVEKATEGYNRACSEKPWFEVLDLTPALGVAAMAVAEACEGYPRPKKDEVGKLVADLHQAQIHHSKLDKFMWEVIELTFPLEEKQQMKLWRAMSSSYHNAFDTARTGNAPASFERAEKFLKAWIQETLNRCWQGFEEPETVFAADTIVEFFKGLIVPGDESGFSCIPPPFVDGERTGDEWEAFLRATYESFTHEWANPPESAAAAKRRRKAEAAAEAGEVDPEIAAIDAELAALTAAG